MTDLSMTKAEQSEYDRLIFAAREASPAVTIGAHPCDETSLPGTLVAAQNRLIIPVLAGTVAKIRATFLAHADAAGIVLGVRVPIVLTSRSHCVRSRLVSRAVATLCAASRRRVTELAA
ncbi:hypothetical protein AM571_CH03641 [Rhizobium etli 8C-3]|uniref:Uncharacterized protein n=1 Tax=Rhizobium etli 8C-3 TaxID=538025 RepID=A0A1L5P8M6_RHIET|nr:hypothetical protein [Rhizobium etli]APO76432.1 hypothetical protein AM571_CH03641 [Rhizobium etli 8C-3]